MFTYVVCKYFFFNLTETTTKSRQKTTFVHIRKTWSKYMSEYFSIAYIRFIAFIMTNEFSLAK